MTYIFTNCELCGKEVSQDGPALCSKCMVDRIVALEGIVGNIFAKFRCAIKGSHVCSGLHGDVPYWWPKVDA